ncbi:MAG: TetR family transcriptional regulator [Ornithinimicrobium sp.]
MTPSSSAVWDSEAGVKAPARRGRGRPPGEGTGARAAIFAAASAQFAAHGYEATSMRGIAGQAGVDASLVAHYFGTKQKLFAHVVEMPIDPARAVPLLVAGPRNEVGHRVATFLLGMIDDPHVRVRAVSLIRAASTNPEAAAIMRERLTEQLLEPLAAAINADQPKFRAAMVMSQTVGLIMARHVVQLEPLEQAERADLIVVLAPVYQHYFTAPLPVR